MQYSFITGLNPLQINMQTFPLCLQFVMQKKVKDQLSHILLREVGGAICLFFCFWQGHTSLNIFLSRTKLIIDISSFDRLHFEYANEVLRISSVQLRNCVWLFVLTHGLQHARSPCPSPAPGACSNSRPLSQWCHPTISSSVQGGSSLLLPSIFPSISVFSSEAVLCVRLLKHCSFSFSISPSNEYSGLISSRIDYSDLPAVHRTLKSLLQHHSSKAAILWCSAFFIVQLSHPYMTTGKTIALTR